MISLILLRKNTMASEYTPDRWVILEIVEEQSKIYKILSGWCGGYVYGDAWRMSSGITDITDNDHYYTITNESGSVYLCHKESYGMSAYMSEIYNDFEQNKSENININIIKVEDVSI